MQQHFEVIGDVMGADVMGYDDEEVHGWGGYQANAQVVGYDEYGEPVVVGRRGRPRPRGRGALVPVQAPQWRERQLAPGVIAPDQGLLPLPMGNFTFSVAAGQTNTFQGQVQKPFRGERLLVTVVRTGTSAVGRLLAQIFVGSDLAQLDVAPVDLEALGNPQAFGVRLTMKPAQPGVFIRCVTALSNAVTGTDSIFASVQLLGKNIH